MPVTLPPGRAKLAMKPAPMGSLTTAVTMGIAAVLSRTARTTRAPSMTMTSGFIATISSTIAGSRSSSPSANRSAIVTLWPSIPAEPAQPVAERAPIRLRHCRTGEAHQGDACRPVGTAHVGRNPGARAASGHAAAALPSSVMNSRRLMSDMGFLPPARAARSACHKAAGSSRDAELALNHMQSSRWQAWPCHGVPQVCVSSPRQRYGTTPA